MQALEPLLLELRDRVIQATGEEPREVLANRGFNREFFNSIPPYMMMAMTPDDPHYGPLKTDEFRFCGMLVRCILPTNITTLVVRV